MAVPVVELYEDEICRQIRDLGFTVIPHALDPTQIAVVNRVIDADLESNPLGWIRFDDTLIETVDILSRTGELDFTIAIIFHGRCIHTGKVKPHSQ